jgi:hypothetical protein
MAITRHFNPSYNFVFTQCTGMVDDNDLRIHILSFQVESRGLTFVRELLDFRHLRKADKLTLQGVIEISELERQRSEDRDFRLALIVNQPLFAQIAQIYAQIISTKNLKTRIFHEDIDGALSWLGYEISRRKQLKNFIRKHRI